MRLKIKKTLTPVPIGELLLPFEGDKMPSYQSRNLEHHGLVAGFCKELGIADIIDKNLGTSEKRNISFGQLFVAMLINGLGFTGRTMHMYCQYFEDKPLERLIGPGIEPEQINDDALGRCLDALYEHGVSELYQKLGETVVKKLGLPCDSIHLDSSSFHYDGEAKTMMIQSFKSPKDIPGTIVLNLTRLS